MRSEFASLDPDPTRKWGDKMAKKGECKKKHSTARAAGCAKAGKRRNRPVRPPERPEETKREARVRYIQASLEHAARTGTSRAQVVRLGVQHGLTGDEVAAVTSVLFDKRGNLLPGVAVGEEWATSLV
jgi:hypothetical protein